MPPSPDDTPTQHTDRRGRRKRRWLFGGFGAMLLHTAGRRLSRRP
jgi:hypothetical protein